VSELATLFAGFGSISFAATATVLLRLPAAVGTTFTVTVALAPLASEPRSHMRSSPACENPPWLRVTVPSVMPPGSVSTASTSVAIPGPLFVTVTV
jgi:hypothetical protein